MEEVNPKKVLALLNGVRQRVFENNEQVTPAMLKERVFADDDHISEDLLGKLCGLCARIMREAAFNAWEPSELEAVLKKTPLPEPMQDIFVRFWAQQRPAVVERARTESAWNDSLSSLSWRIDLRSSSSGEGKLDMSSSKASAIVEMVVGQKGGGESSNEIVRFEMDREQLAQTRRSIAEIEAKLQQLSGQAPSS